MISRFPAGYDHSTLAIVSTLFVILLILFGRYQPVSILGDTINPGAYALNSKPFGLEYEDWIIKFWQWLHAIPTDINPTTDNPGTSCGYNQTYPVFFLTFASSGSAQRVCDVPAGKAILVPILVNEYSFAEMPEAKSESDLDLASTKDASSNPRAYLSVDGKEFKDILSYRVHTRPFDLSFAGPTREDNIFAAEPGPSRAVSDGYWVILEPLPEGRHTITFGGGLTGPALDYSVHVEYQINIR